MKYRMTGDGTTFTGRGYDDIVAKMAQEKLTEPASLDTYRRATARRISEGFGVLVDASNSRRFVESLVAAKLMERVA